MKGLSLFVSAAVLCGSTSAMGASPATCHVIGDTSDNNPTKSLGSVQNPYGSLVDVEANADCETIIVLYSSIVLDGGIVLRDGQQLEGKKGPGGELPVITNSTTQFQGVGVVLARDNRLKHLHIQDTQNSGISGGLGAPLFGGDLVIQNILVTGANQSAEIFLSAFAVFSPSILLVPAADIDITIKNSEVGEANVSSIIVYQLDGHADIRISNTTVRDQGEVSADFEVSPGIAVLATGSSSSDVTVIDTAVHNIGGAILSNSDGLLFINLGSGAMTVKVDGYRYSNPDEGGYSGTSTGIEITFFASQGGGSLDGVVTNSVIEDAFAGGIQVGDQSGGGSNFLNVHIHDNEIYNTVVGSGISMDTGGSPNGTHTVTIENNLIVNAGFAGISYDNFISQQTLVEMLIQNNTIIGAAYGLAFVQEDGASAAILNLDAGLGGLGSQGNNRIIDSQVADIFVGAFDCCGFPPTPPFTVDAANNWWGSEAGPATVIELGGATVDYTPFLTKEPKGPKIK